MYLAPRVFVSRIERWMLAGGVGRPRHPPTPLAFVAIGFHFLNRALTSASSRSRRRRSLAIESRSACVLVHLFTAWRASFMSYLRAGVSSTRKMAFSTFLSHLLICVFLFPCA